jgi:DNA-binding IclR family transcriptional regulator
MAIDDLDRQALLAVRAAQVHGEWATAATVATRLTVDQAEAARRLARLVDNGYLVVDQANASFVYGSAPAKGGGDSYSLTERAGAALED